MSMLTTGAGRHQVPAAGLPGPPTLVSVGADTLSQSGTVWSNAAVPIGTASASRLVIITMAGISFGRAYVSSTINGVSTGGADFSLTNGNEFICCISAIVATGTTADVAVTMDDTLFSGLNIQVYTVDSTGLSSTTKTGAGTVSGSTAGLTTSAFAETVDGVAVAVGRLNANETSLAVTGFTTTAFGGTANVIFAEKNGIAATNASATEAMTWTGATTAVFGVAAWR